HPRRGRETPSRQARQRRRRRRATNPPKRAPPGQAATTSPCVHPVDHELPIADTKRYRYVERRAVLVLWRVLAAVDDRRLFGRCDPYEVVRFVCRRVLDGRFIDVEEEPAALDPSTRIVDLARVIYGTLTELALRRTHRLERRRVTGRAHVGVEVEEVPRGPDRADVGVSLGRRCRCGRLDLGQI